MTDDQLPKGPKHEYEPPLPFWQALVLGILYSVAFFWLPFGMFIWWWVAVR